MANSVEEQLAANEAEKTEKITETEAIYDGIAQNYQAATDNSVAALEQFETQQKELLNRQTDFAIQQIQQQKDQSQKDYEKEQSAAYVDFKKQSNRYGAIAEQQAAVGMTGTGYSESSQVSMYNQYQNRVAVAREAHQQAIVSYNNSMTQARLTNDVELARIAQETFMKTQELIMQNVIKQGELAIQKTEALAAIDQNYYNRGQDIKQEAATATATARSNLINAILAGRNPETVSDEELAAAGMTRAEAMAYFGTYTSEKEATDADLAYKNATVTGTNYELMVSQLTNGLDPMAVDENGNYVLTDEALAAAGMTRAMAQAFYNEWKAGKDEEAGTARKDNQNRIIELVSKYGFTGFSDEELEAAGMTREDVQQMYQLWHGETTQGGNQTDEDGGLIIEGGDGGGNQTDENGGLIIEGGDGGGNQTALTEAELLNDPSKYDMAGLAALGNDLTEEELEMLIDKGLVTVKAETMTQRVVFSISNKKGALDALNVYRRAMGGKKATYDDLITGFGAIPTGTSTTPSVSTMGQTAAPSRQSPKRQAGGVGGPQLYDPEAYTIQ